MPIAPHRSACSQKPHARPWTYNNTTWTKTTFLPLSHAAVLAVQLPSYQVLCLCVASVVGYPCMRCLWLKCFKCDVMWGRFLSFSQRTFHLQSTSNMHCGFECRKCVLCRAADSEACGNGFGDLEFDCCREHVGRHVSMCLSAQMCALRPCASHFHQKY